MRLNLILRITFLKNDVGSVSFRLGIRTPYCDCFGFGHDINNRESPRRTVERFSEFQVMTLFTSSPVSDADLHFGGILIVFGKEDGSWDL